VSLGDRIIERVRAASLEDLARAVFLADVPAEPPAEGDAARVADAIVAALAKKNQFAASEPALASGVRRAIDTLFESPNEAAFARAGAELAALFREALGESPREVTSATYSPELQLAILGLSQGALHEPILDIGCGEDAALVRFLRAAGKKATGIDAHVSSDVAERADWLAYDYGTARFGTIVSHLGFSLHFMHQEMKRSDLAFEYGRAYMRILRALARGGTFAYVPGLPFIESMLPTSDFVVKRAALASDLLTENVSRVQEATGLVLDSSTHVVRR
jgi:hypothetical protein